jgi:hypothetical protein
MKTYNLEEIDKIKLEDYDRVIIPANLNNFLFRCCDCGLKHRVYFKVYKSKIIARLVRE